MNGEQTIKLPIYAIDVSVLIEAKNRYYAFDICPGFWDSILFHHKNSRIESIDKIKDEINAGNADDELRKWIKLKIPNSFFNTIDEVEITQKYGELANWVQRQGQFSHAAKARFSASADGWLVSYAKIKDRNVVTQEVLRPDIKRDIPIPNICEAFGVRCIDTFKMLQELKTQFILSGD